MTKQYNAAGNFKRITTHPRREARYRRAVERNISRAEDRMQDNPAHFLVRCFIGAKPYVAAIRLGIRKNDASMNARIHALCNE